MKFFMKGLLFLSRLAFICNLLFFVCLVLQRTHDLIGNRELESMIGVLGWILAPFVNLAVNSWYAVLLIRKRPILLPVWLAVANFLFLLVEIFVHFILPV